MIFGHVDGGPDGSGKDGKGGVQEIHFDRDIVRWRAILVAHLDLHRRHKTMLFDCTKEKIHNISGPHSEVEGVAWFEVLYHVLEGHHIRRLHNFNASLLCFHQIAACAEEQSEKYQPRSHIPLKTGTRRPA